MSDQPQSQGDRSGSDGAPSSAGLAPPPPIKVPAAAHETAAVEANEEFPSEVEMTLVGHLEELRSRVLRSLLAVVVVVPLMVLEIHLNQSMYIEIKDGLVR